MSRCVSCSSGSAVILNKNLLISPIQIPIRNAVKVGANNTSSRLRVRVSMVDSSSDFARRIERACNQGQSYVHLAAQKDILNVNGVRVLGFLFLVITCFVKSHPETLAVLFALERDQCAVLIVKEQAFVQSGWENLLLPSTKTTTQMVEHGF
ncbi:Lariat debranching enzyme [Spatholobus suberectus]|nr:Lariat debranching enzyme [Spatholobus suberectus]